MEENHQVKRVNMPRQVPVREMFNGRSVFITGASGFIGRVLLAKLLGTYPGIKNIYVLLRPKKNLKPEERLNKHIFQLPIFDHLRAQKSSDQNGAHVFDKVRVVSGDLGDEWLGMSAQDLDTLISDKTLGIIFHAAATIKFDEPLRVSVKLNLVATKTIIDLCRRLPNLISFCHVSTAYVNSDILNNDLIHERLYPMREQPETLIEMAKLMDEPMMQQLKSHLVDKRPNTYTYTKALAEHLIAKEATDLPVVIVRPSIVVASLREPMPGWIDNLNGPSGLLLAINKGLLRTMYVKTSGKADLIPVDVTVNTMIASAYYVAKKYNKLTTVSTPTSIGTTTNNNNREKSSIITTSDDIGADQVDQADDYSNRNQKKKPAEKLERPYIVHCNSGHLNPITWGQLEKQVFPIIRNHPSEQVMRYPFGTFKENYYHDLATRFFVHLLPALILDMILYLSGRKRFVVSIYAKLHGAVGALTHFCTNNYNFETKNLSTIKSELSPSDRITLSMNIEQMNWDDYWRDYVVGTRRYILKEKDESLPEARRNLQRALWIERVLRTVLCFLAMTFFLRVILPTIRGSLTNIWIR